MGAWVPAIVATVLLLLTGIPARANHPLPWEGPPIQYGVESAGSTWVVIDFHSGGQDMVLDIRTADPELVALRWDVYRADGTLLNGYEIRIDTRAADLNLGPLRYDVSAIGFEYSLPGMGGGGDLPSGGVWSSHDLGSTCRKATQSLLWSSGGSETLRIGPPWENARLQVTLDGDCLGSAELRAIGYIASTGFEGTMASIRSTEEVRVLRHATGREVYLRPVASGDEPGVMATAIGFGAQVARDPALAYESGGAVLGVFDRLGTPIAHAPGQPSSLSYSNAVSSGSCPCAWPLLTTAGSWTFRYQGAEIHAGGGAYLSLARIDPAALG